MVLKVRLLKTEVLEKVQYACVTWSPKPAYYVRLRPITVCSLRCLGLRRRKREDSILSYASVLVEANSESFESTVRGRKSLFAGVVACL